MVKVSIIIPVYNVERYIERCIKSVIRQSFTDLECIIVDDGSTDSSITICQTLIGEYTGRIEFKIVRHKTTGGPSGARNVGTDLAVGDYVFYLDSDDEITENCIELLFKETTKHPDVEIVQGCTKSEHNNDYYSLTQYKDISYINDNTKIRHAAFNMDDPLPADVWNKLIRKEFLLKNNIRFEEGIIHEDELWSFNVAMVLKQLAIVHDETYIHYSVPCSIMTSLSQQRSDESWNVILKKVVPSMMPPCLKEQIQVYLYEYLIRFHDTINENYDDILCSFITKAKQEGLYCLLVSLVFYQRFKKSGSANSTRQWMITYCKTGNKKKLWAEIISDLRAWLSKKMKTT